jgi:hypothetical protein
MNSAVSASKRCLHSDSKACLSGLSHHLARLLKLVGESPRRTICGCPMLWTGLSAKRAVRRPDFDRIDQPRSERSGARYDEVPVSYEGDFV